MKLRRIAIKKYKNIRDFECEFSSSNISAFIGNNGSGKSNLIEALTSIFGFVKSTSAKMNPKLIVTPQIEDYEIEYECDGLVYLLEGSYNNYTVSCNGKVLPKLGVEAALPETIMVYYAGETKRQLNTAKSTFDSTYDNGLKKADNNSFPGFKFLDYYSADDLNLLFLTAVTYKGNYYEKLLDLLNCKEIMAGTTFMLKCPPGTKSKHTADTYWGAKGFVKSFLDEIRRFVSRTVDLSEYYMMIFDDIRPIKNTSSDAGTLFAKLKALKNAGYLHSVSIKLLKNDGEVFEYDELSEGEKQLSLLMLLTSFTAQNNCLYLFDEFDAYLHLNWQREFGRMLNEINVNGHLIFTTHSPATVSKIKSDELFIMKNGVAEYPDSETYNRALDEIMFEHMDVSMRAPEIEALYNSFKQCIADKNREGALQIVRELESKLDESDPLFDRIKLNLRRI